MKLWPSVTRIFAGGPYQRCNPHSLFDLAISLFFSLFRSFPHTYTCTRVHELICLIISANEPAAGNSRELCAMCMCVCECRDASLVQSQGQRSRHSNMAANLLTDLLIFTSCIQDIGCYWISSSVLFKVLCRRFYSNTVCLPLSLATPAISHHRTHSFYQWLRLYSFIFAYTRFGSRIMRWYGY